MHLLHSASLEIKQVRLDVFKIMFNKQAPGMVKIMLQNGVSLHKYGEKLIKPKCYPRKRYCVFTETLRHETCDNLSLHELPIERRH